MRNEPDWTPARAVYQEFHKLDTEVRALKTDFGKQRRDLVDKAREHGVEMGRRLARLRQQYTNAEGGLDVNAYSIARKEQFPKMSQQDAVGWIRLAIASDEDRLAAFKRGPWSLYGDRIARYLPSTSIPKSDVDGTGGDVDGAPEKPAPKDSKAILAKARREARQIVKDAEKEAKRLVDEQRKEIYKGVAEKMKERTALLDEREDQLDRRDAALKKYQNRAFGKNGEAILVLDSVQKKQILAALHPDRGRQEPEIQEKQSKAFAIFRECLH